MPRLDGASPGVAAPRGQAEEADDEGTRPGPAAAEPQAPRPDRPELRERILDAARRMLGRRPRLDCSGFILAAYRAAGFSAALPRRWPRSEALLEAGGAVPIPRPGDLAFFHDTYDRNRNGKVDDGITHVALVEAVEGDLVTLLHRGRKVERIRMDLAAPSDPSLNDQIRFRRRRDPPRTRYLSGELFALFAALPDGLVAEPPRSAAEGARARSHARRRTRERPPAASGPSAASPVPADAGRS